MSRFFLLLFLYLSFVCPAVSETPLTLADRIQAQEKIERVYYNHHLWPNPSPKPSFEQMVPRSVIEKKVNDSLSVPISAQQLQAEMDRIARTTKDPAMLQELFSALNNDPNLIAETLVRPIVADRMIHGNKFVHSKKRMKKNYFRLPEIISGSSCGGWDILDASNPPSPRSGHTAIWTGTEMIVWGGNGLNTGGRYDPALNTWTATSTGANVPSGRFGHTAVWTGIEMIVWGGSNTLGGSKINTGGRYDPLTDTWTATSVGANVPEERGEHSAVWTGSEMVVWGGVTTCCVIKTGGRYDPSTDSWQPTSIGLNVPESRYYHSAVWTGQEMIVWGGLGSSFDGFSTGGRYNPFLDSWLPTSLVNNPQGRFRHTAVWTGNEIIIWGGDLNELYIKANSGAKYDPVTDVWQAIPTIGAPLYRNGHTAVWSGTEMIIWGGFSSRDFDYDELYTQTGGRYSLVNDSWVGTAIGPNAPSKRAGHTAVWIGTKMIVFGGFEEALDSNQKTATGLDASEDSGGIYSPETDNIVVDPPALPNAEVDIPYVQTISASGGAFPYTMSLVEGSLADGLSFDGSTGVISGTATNEHQWSIFAITATDSNFCPGSRSYYFVVCPVLTFSPASLPDGALGNPYNQTISVSGTNPPNLFSITAGVLPDGLMLDESTGIINGRPTALGTFNFTITVNDYHTCTKSHDYTINISKPCLSCG